MDEYTFTVTILPTYTITLPTSTNWYISTGNTWIPVTIGSQGITINPPTASSEEPEKSKEDGCTCKRCKNFSPFAEANQRDGSFICYGCRSTI